MNLLTPTILIAPDSFKGTLTAPQAAAAIAQGLAQVLPQAHLVMAPLADGGEGTLAILLAALQGTQHLVPVPGAAGQPILATAGLCCLNGQITAILEAAEVVGITHPNAMAQPILQRTTLGLGELIRWALNQDAQRILIGLGGSCTNDGGAGVLVGLGATLLNAQGQPLPPTPEHLPQIATVDFSQLDPRLATCRIQILSDVNNPLCGPQGATYIFGPQKGLLPHQRQPIDQAIAHFATCAEQAMAQQRYPASTEAVQDLPGSGAAGGLGFALRLLGGTYGSGASYLAQLIGLPQQLHQADWLITGEGKSDRQTIQGKGPWVVAQMAQAQGIPVTLLSGGIDPRAGETLIQHFGSSCFSLAPGPFCCFPPPDAPPSLQACRDQAQDWLVKAGQQLGRRWQERMIPN